MKHLAIFLFLSAMFIACTSRQAPTNFEVEVDLKADDEQQLNNLFILCKSWGFVKYYHPMIAKGMKIWDNELIHMMALVDEENFKSELQNWIQALGEINEKELVEAEEKQVKLRASTEWIYDEDLLSKALCESLSSIQKASDREFNYYVEFMKGVGNPKFKHEDAYEDMDWANVNYRMLALFRYWNMIEYFFPYKHLMDENWDEVLKEFIPKMIEADDELSYKLTLLGLIGKVQDTHANIWQQDSVLSEFHGKKIAPIEINFVENEAVVVRKFDQLVEGANINIGDIISAVNGIDVKEIVEDKRKYCPASNGPTQLRDVARRLVRTNEETIQITLKRGELSLQENLPTVETQQINFWKKDIPSHKELEGDIGYIYPASLKKGEIHEIMESFINKKGLVVDLRCYPSDFIVFSLGKYLMPIPTEFVKFTFGGLEFPGQFTFGQTLKVGEENPDYFKGKVIILINETTQSQAEYTTMALSVAPKATVIGSTTAAADGNVSTIFLPGNVRTMISGIGVYYPDGTETQRVGIIPDIELRPSIDGIRNGKDELLEKAIEIIRE